MTDHRFEDFSVALRQTRPGHFIAELRELYLFAEGESVDSAYQKLKESYENLCANANQAGAGLPGPDGKVGDFGGRRSEILRFAAKAAVVALAATAVAWVSLAKLDQMIERQAEKTEARVHRMLSEDGRISAVDLVIKLRDRLNKMPEERKLELKRALQEIADEAEFVLPALGEAVPDTSEHQSQ